jgi:hypothetical protein
MNRRSWKVWVAGISLVLLLIVGIGVAVWPTPSEAQKKAAMIYVGMTESHLYETLNPLPPTSTSLKTHGAWRFDDGSILNVGYDKEQRVDWIRARPADPPLTRLRRNLAGVFPFLAD